MLRIVTVALAAAAVTLAVVPPAAAAASQKGAPDLVISQLANPPESANNGDTLV